MVLAIDSLVASSSSAEQASAINSVARGPTMCTPSSSSYFFSETIFTRPPDSPRMRALALAVKGNLPTFTSFRHSFATHLLQSGHDIRTVQELKTTMIYTHVLGLGASEMRSPLDALGAA